LTGDGEAQAAEATHVIEGASTLVISTLVLCELVWVLKRHYRFGRAEIGTTIRMLVQSGSVETDRITVAAGLSMLERGGDFADGVIQHEARHAKCDTLVTFTQNFASLAAPGTVALLGAG
jgi:predicted nucleic-acid-binding protein